jgi:hypothetical protein
MHRARIRAPRQVVGRMMIHGLLHLEAASLFTDAGVQPPERYSFQENIGHWHLPDNATDLVFSLVLPKDVL